MTSPPLARQEPPIAELTRRLLDYLLSRNVSPGAKLPPERQLATALGVGRGTLREAIQSLNLLGLLVVRHGDGTYLSSSTSEFLPRIVAWGLLLGKRPIVDLMEARSHIEIAAAGLAAERSGSDSVERLRRRIADMRDATDLASYVEADIAFHLEVGNASQNEVFNNMLHSIEALLRDWATQALELDGEIDVALAMHLPIVEAIERRDPAAARDAMARHNARWQRRIRRVLGVDGAESPGEPQLTPDGP